jgi:formylglycine-generating enzyme required for sulfatase activity
MGSAEGDALAWPDEQPQHTVTLPTFYISRDPITNSQFAAFIDAGGYAEERYWTADGWLWRTGQREPDLSVIENETRRERYAALIARRPSSQRDRPFGWESAGNAPCHPVVGVSWHEAVAFCAWLGVQLQTTPDQLVQNGDQVERLFLPPASVSLPSEAEWEKAARGTDGRLWPWGDLWQPGYANTAETGWNAPREVSSVPANASPYGVLDMAGNVWEWTRNNWGQRARQVESGYPYDPKDGREAPEGSDLRIVRGGSWNDDQRRARSAERGRHAPEYASDSMGFRVVVLPSTDTPSS